VSERPANETALTAPVLRRVDAGASAPTPGYGYLDPPVESPCGANSRAAVVVHLTDERQIGFRHTSEVTKQEMKLPLATLVWDGRDRVGRRAKADDTPGDRTDVGYEIAALIGRAVRRSCNPSL
jgi:hypothetical protein